MTKGIMFDISNDSFPETIDDITKLFVDERTFEGFLLDQGPWFWRQMGLRGARKNGNQTPDILAEINDRRKGSSWFGVEVEHAARNFTKHDHSRHNVHLVISCWATLGYHTVRCIPVVSLYRKCPDGLFRYSLENDIGFLFQGLPDHLLNSHGGRVPDDEP